MSAGLTQSSFGRHCLAIYNRFAVKTSLLRRLQALTLADATPTLRLLKENTKGPMPMMYGKKVGTPKLSSMKTVKC